MTIRPARSTIRTRWTAAAMTFAATLAVTACGSSPLTRAGSSATKAAATTAPAAATTVAPTPTTAAPTTTAAPSASTAPPTTKPAGGSATAFCATIVARGRSLVKDGRALEGLTTTRHPTAAETRDLEAIARDFESLVRTAPPAIKPDLKTAAHVYSELAAAFRTKNVAKIEAAGMALESAHAVEDLVEVETYAETHCAGA